MRGQLWDYSSREVKPGAALRILQMDAAGLGFGWQDQFDATVPVTQAFGDAAATGSAVVAARRDHVHGIPAIFDGTAPVTQAMGDVAGGGSATVAAKRDHKHGMPSFATNALVLGTSAAAGAATTPMRSNDTIAAFDATVPVTQAAGDSAATGSAAVAARRDHKHGMPAFGNVDVLAKGDGSSNGVATTLARSDHNHGDPTLYPSILHVTSAFSKTNTTLGNVTGLSVGLPAGQVVAVSFALIVTAGGGGIKLAWNVSAGVLSSVYGVGWTVTSAPATTYYDLNSSSLGSQAQFLDNGLSTVVRVFGEFKITVGSASTLTLQMAQSSASGTTTIGLGGVMVVTQG